MANRHKFTKEERIKGGQISKRKPLDQVWKDKLEAIENGQCTNDEIFDMLKNEVINNKNLFALQHLYDRAYGPVKKDNVNVNVDTRPIVVLPEQQKKYIEGD